MKILLPVSTICIMLLGACGNYNKKNRSAVAWTADSAKTWYLAKFDSLFPGDFSLNDSTISITISNDILQLSCGITSYSDEEVPGYKAMCPNDQEKYTERWYSHQVEFRPGKQPVINPLQPVTRKYTSFQNLTEDSIVSISWEDVDPDADPETERYVAGPVALWNADTAFAIVQDEIELSGLFHLNACENTEEVLIGYTSHNDKTYYTMVLYNVKSRTLRSTSGHYAYYLRKK